MDHIGKYRIEAELGRGGFGRVYRAYDPTVGRSVAIKVLLAAGDKDILARFRLEATATGKLRHRNIITVFDFGEHEGTPYLVMEYLEGEDLQRIIASGRSLSILDKVSVMSQVADGLHHAHQSGLVHRDVKPANVMILPDGTVKIMDFGIARAVRDAGTRLTQHGNLIGTLSYMAPELFQGGEVDHLCDIFAYGVIHYELLTGRHPFPATEPGAVVYSITTVRPPSIRLAAPECPEALEEIIFRTLEKQREARYQSLEDVVFDLTPIRLHLQAEQGRSLLRDAEELLRGGRTDEARAAVRQVLQLDPNNAAARELREKIQREAQFQAVRERCAGLVANGREELTRGEYARSVETFESVLRLDSGNVEARQLLAEARDALERVQRAALLLAAARQNLEANNLTDAYRNVVECVRQSPDFPEAAALLDTIRRAIERRERERRLAEELARVDALAREERFDEALNLLGDLEAGYPSAQQVKERVAAVHFAREEHLRRRQLASGVEAAQHFIGQRNWPDAATALERLSRQFPENAEVAALLAYAQEELRAQQKAEDIARIVREARALAEARDFDRAVSLVNSGLRAYPNEDSFQAMLGRIGELRRAHERQAAIERTTAHATELAGRKSFQQALEVIENTLKSWDATELAPLRDRIEQERTQHERAEAVAGAAGSIHSLVRGRRYEEAVQRGRDALARFPDEPAVVAAAQAAEQALAEQRREERLAATIAEAHAQATRLDFDRALGTLQSALMEWPARATITEAIASVQAAKLTHRHDTIQQLSRERQLDEASQRIAEAIQEFPEEPSLLKLRDAIAADRRALARWEAIQAALAEAGGLRDRGEYAAAIARLDTVDRSHPADVSVADMLAEVRGLQQAAERVENALRNARQLADRREFDQALQVIQDVVGRHPDERLTALATEVTAARAASDRERGVRVALERARLLASQGHPGKAVEALDHALKKLAGDPALIAERDRLGEEIARATRVAETVTKAHALADRKQFDDAAQIVEATLGSSTDPRLEGVLAEIQRARREHALAAACDEIEAALRAGALEKAAQGVQSAILAHPDEERLASLDMRVREEFAQRERRAQVAAIAAEVRVTLGDQKIEEAIRVIEDALREFPGEPELAALRSYADEMLEARRRADALAQATRKARSLLQEELAAEAEALLQAALRQFPDEESLSALLARATADRQSKTRRDGIDRALRESDAHRQNGTLEEAAGILDAALRDYPGESALLEAKNATLLALAESEKQAVLIEARQESDRRHYDAAAALLRGALVRFPGDAEVQSALAAALAAHESARDSALRIVPAAVAAVEQPVVAPVTQAQAPSKVDRAGEIAAAAATGTPARHLEEPARSQRAGRKPRKGDQPRPATPAPGPATAAQTPPEPFPPPVATPPVAASSPRAPIIPAPQTQPPARSADGRKIALGVAAGLAAVVIVGVLYSRNGATDKPVAPPRPPERPIVVPEPVAAKPKILRFYATRASIVAGQPVSLCYSVQDARSVRVEPSTQRLAPGLQRCFAISPPDTAEYKLVATGTDGSEVSESLTVAVQQATATAGRLIVETRLDGVNVFVSGRKYRTAGDGLVELQLEPQTYVVRAEKAGFATPPPRSVRIREGAEQRIAFSLVPNPAILAIQGATPGASVILDGQAPATVAANGALRLTVAPGTWKVLLRKQGYVDKTVVVQLSPGQTWTPSGQEVSLAEVKAPPPPEPVKPIAPTRTVASRLWEPLQNSSDVAALEAFRRNYPGTPEADAASRRIEQIQAETARARQDAERAAWERLDRRSAAALRAYLRENRGSSYAAQAAAELARLEQQEQSGSSQLQIQRVLAQYARAIESKDLRAMRAAYPTMDARTAQSYQATFKEVDRISVTLRPVSDVTVTGDRAVVRCERITNVQHRGQSAPNRDSVTVTLARQGEEWVIQSIATP